MALHTESVLSLCSGVGGLELGLELARPSLRTVCYVEREAYAATVLATRMAEAQLDDAPIWDDLRTFDGKPWRGLVQGVVSGFPCQPWSVAGKRKGTDDEHWIWPDIARIIDEVEPGWCFFENVPGLVKRGLPIILRDLAERGFDAEWDVFSAAEVGASHRRKRVCILAYSNSAGRSKQRGGWLLDTQRQAFGYDADRRNHEMADERPAWPPGPTDEPGWLRFLEQVVGLEPVICRSANGLANRVDQFRACGNGVVPLAAANAYRILSARLMA